jgi:polyisoprenoid-binding protein YceI
MEMTTRLLSVALLALLAACSKQAPAPLTPPAPATESAAPASPAKVDLPSGAYKLDRLHSSLLLQVSHLGFSNYVARFKTFDAQLQFDPDDFATATLTVTVDPKSLDVESPPAGFLDSLLGKAWLDTGQFPELTYRSTSVEATGPDSMRITGDLTLHGVTKPVVLEATFNGGYAGHPLDPNARIGFSARGAFNRSDFGITYGIPEPGTTMGVGDRVDVSIETEFSGPPFKPKQDAGSASGIL